MLLCLSMVSDAAAARIETTVQSMGTTFHLVVYGENDARVRTAVERASNEILRLNRLLSNYSSTSEWSRVNRLAGQQPVTVSDELFGLLSDCVEYSRLSDGAFDISVGALMKVWGFYRGSGRLPGPAEVARSLEHVGYRHIVLDSRRKSVRFAKEGLELDPGGIGKGYAVDRVATILRAGGITSALISAGGSSIFGIGHPPGEPRGWRTTIRDPKGGQVPVAEVFLNDESLSTSGTDEKFFDAGGRRYSHIMDPRTGYPAQGMLSVSVIAPRTLDSEAWTKPFFIRGRDWAAGNKPRGFQVLLCEETSIDSPSACVWLR
jgi:thiamine biosynthesis lipoprotein